MNDARRFGIADGLILIAGVGVGLGLDRYVAPGTTLKDLLRVFLGPPGGWSPRYTLQVGAELCVLFITPLVTAWTIACLLVQLKRRRRHRLEPGYVACLLPIFGVALTIGVTWTFLGRTGWGPVHPNGGDLEPAQFVGSLLGGSGVLWAWATMKLCGIRHAQPTWTDRLGRLTGIVWVAIGVLSAGYLLLLV